MNAAIECTAEMIEAMDHECTCCGRALKPGKKVWLERDCISGTYHAPGSVPDERSQGEFPFGRPMTRRSGWNNWPVAPTRTFYC